jgi:nucleoside permease NupC
MEKTIFVFPVNLLFLIVFFAVCSSLIAFLPIFFFVFNILAAIVTLISGKKELGKAFS